MRPSDEPKVGVDRGTEISPRLSAFFFVPFSEQLSFCFDLRFFQDENPTHLAGARVLIPIGPSFYLCPARTAFQHSF
jgi:hypothetical protein